MSQRVKNLPAMQETPVQSQGWEDLLEKEMAPHSGVLAWKIPLMEEPGGLQSLESRRAGHDWATSLHSLYMAGYLTLHQFFNQIFLYHLFLQWLVLSRSVVSDCDHMDCSPPGSSVHGDFPGKNTGVGCHALLQGIFPTQGLNSGLLHCRILYHLSYQGSPSVSWGVFIKKKMWKYMLAFSWTLNYAPWIYLFIHMPLECS